MPDDNPLKIPPGTLRLEIDEPAERRITRQTGTIRGWFASRDLELPETFDLCIGGLSLPYRVTKRVDVEAAMPQYVVVGFTLPYDLANYLPNIENNRLTIDLTMPGFERHRLRFTILDSALADCLAASGDV